MKQLSGLDASFLYMETPSQFGHVSSLSIFAKPDDPDYDPFAAWRTQIEQRLHLLEPLRRKVRDVPMRLDHPFWIDDAGNGVHNNVIDEVLTGGNIQAHKS